MSHLRIAAIAALTGALAACSDQPGPDLTAPPADSHADAVLQTAGSEHIPGQYVVVYKEGSGAAPASAPAGVDPIHVYNQVLQGFAARLTPAQVEQLRGDPAVAYVAEDMMAYPTQEGVTPATVQSSAIWGLDRLDQARLPMDGFYRYTTTGPVNVYVIDTGVRITHNEFDGLAPNRASLGKDYTGGNGADCNGHGTHVAGTVAGTTYGVAKAARIISVRVFGCTGGAPFSRIIAAMEWVAKNRVRPAVVNMSLEGGFFQPINDAVAHLVAREVTVVVAAGNGGTNACTISPASAPMAITVSNSTTTDARYVSSNYGSCTDVYAPGDKIKSAWYTSDVAVAFLTGTSMASPQVAGLAAQYLGRNPTAHPALVAEIITDDATPNIVSGFVSGQNRLANRWNGMLNRAGTSQIRPVNHDCVGCHYFTTSAGGNLRAWLAGTPGTNFNMQLYRWNGSAWILVATEATPSTNETMTYFYPTAASYFFLVSSVLNGGTFDLFVAKT